MDPENNHKNRRERRQLSSLLQGDDDDYNLFFDRVISRDSSVGCSSRIYYCRRNTEGVPFQWEMQPGTPKDPPKQDLIPQLSPPPAIINSGMPKPCIDVIEERSKASVRSRFWFWLLKRKTKNRKIKTIHRNNSVTSTVDHKNEAILDFCGGSTDGGESWVTPRNSRSSSSLSSSLSFSNGRSRHSSRLDSPARESVAGHYGCSPLNFNSVLVSIARRV